MRNEYVTSIVIYSDKQSDLHDGTMSREKFAQIISKYNSFSPEKSNFGEQSAYLMPKSNHNGLNVAIMQYFV